MRIPATHPDVAATYGRFPALRAARKQVLNLISRDTTCPKALERHHHQLRGIDAALVHMLFLSSPRRGL